MTNMVKVLVTVSGGMADATVIMVPKGITVEVEVRDYDTDNTDFRGMTQGVDYDTDDTGKYLLSSVVSAPSMEHIAELRRPTTDKRVHFKHIIKKDDKVPGFKKYTFVSTGRDEGSYIRELHAYSLRSARNMLRTDFPNAIF